MSDAPTAAVRIVDRPCRSATGQYRRIQFYAADRGVNVRVASDDAAYVGVENQSPVEGVVDGEALTLFELSDNTGNDLTVDASVPSDAPIEIESATFGDGVTARCTDSTDGDAESVDVTITASGPGLSAELTRTIEVSCVPPIEAEDVTFYGCGNAAIDGHESKFPLDVTLIGYDGNEFVETQRTVNTAGSKTGGGPKQLVGLAIPSEDLVVTNPNYLEGNCSDASNGNPASGVSGDPRDDS